VDSEFLFYCTDIVLTVCLPIRYHQSIAQVYMALVPSGQDPATWEPTGAVWFKVGEMAPITDGGNSITWTAMGAQYVPFTIPQDTPSGTYLVRTENVALREQFFYFLLPGRFIERFQSIIN
jgi:hypothetical protein